LDCICLFLIFSFLAALEMFGFQPKIIFKEVTKDEYLYFLTYCLEYRAIVMEQMSHEIEEKYKSENPNEEDRIDGYGVMLLDFTIRDLKGWFSQLCFMFTNKSLTLNVLFQESVWHIWGLSAETLLVPH
jgi:hypothetical protein